MNLRALAESDLKFIVEDPDSGFGWPIVITNPEGLTRSFTGLSDDIAQAIDVETGMIVSGRTASISLRTSTILAEGFALPEGIADTSKKPWIVQFDDINGSPHTFKIAQSYPDRTLGLVRCILSIYKNA